MVANKKLDRERGEERLKNYTLSDSEIKHLSNWIFDKLEGFIEQVENMVLVHHENCEFRVRIAAGQLMGSLCKYSGLELFMRYLPTVIRGVTTNIERNGTSNSEIEYSIKELEISKERDEDTNQSLSSILHDTAGWKNLETWMKCLQEMVNGLSSDEFIQVNREEILNLIFKAVEHVNRFVRETGYDLLDTMILHRGCYKNPTGDGEANYIIIAEQLAKGLSDNWSQVRMAASRATRTFFKVDPPPNYSKTVVYPMLLPPMCLNRFYIAEGVRIYSHDTWCQVIEDQGKRLLGEYLEHVLSYYLLQSDAENHAVREAACAAISEVVVKLDSSLLKPFIQTLLDGLLTCFGDQSWPVRDAACCALGSLISYFPEQTREAGHHDLLATYFLRNLYDSIPSVREGAARSIALILKSTNDPELIKLYSDYIQEKLKALANQPSESYGSESHRVLGHGPGSTQVNVLSGSKAHDSRHTNQVMYSCGSLAPKLQKGRKGGGCHDGFDQRKSEPWEEADGALRLISQIAEHCQNLFCDQFVCYIVEAASHKHYVHYPYFLETASDMISIICQNLAKPIFKKYVDDFLTILASAVQTELPLAVDAALHSLKVMAAKVGPTILHGRIQNHIDSYVSKNLSTYLQSVS